MPVTIEFHFDVGSPNAYVSHKVIPAIEARTGQRFRYLPVLAHAELDGPALLGKAQEPELKATPLAHTESAHARGAFGSPTFFVDGEICFGKDRLREVEEAIAAAAAR